MCTAMTCVTDVHPSDRARAAAFASLAFLALAAQAQLTDNTPFEADGHVRLVAVRTAPGAAKVYAVLTNCTEVTLTMNLALTNATASEPLPLTVDSAGRTFFELATIRSTTRADSWGYGGQFSWQYGRRGEPVTRAPPYDLPYKSGAYVVSQAARGRTHTDGSGAEFAIDWAMPVGTVVCAAREGTVVALRSDSTLGVKNPKFASSGNFVIIRHEDNTFAEYGHLKRKGVVVWLGQSVARGAVLGFSGGTGYSSGPHLHFGVFQNVDAAVRRSLPVQFKTRSGTVETLKTGVAY